MDRTILSRGRPMTLLGPELQPGDLLPDFTLVDFELLPVTRQELVGKPLLLNVVPSLDTSACSAQTRRFNRELVTLPASVDVVTISADLPFAQARYAEVERIGHRLLSDHRAFSFGTAVGVGIRDLRLLARAIFVVDPDGRIVYREIVPELLNPPIYETPLTLVRSLA